MSKSKQAIRGIGWQGHFKPEFKTGTGKVIIPWEKQPYQNDRGRSRLIDQGKKYFEKNKHKLSYFEIFDHPGNESVFRFPFRGQKRLILWLKYKPSQAPIVAVNGTIKAELYLGKDDFGVHNTIVSDFLKKIQEEKRNGKIWLAKIFEHPGNILLFDWSEDEGELFPGGLLESQNLIQSI